MSTLDERSWTTPYPVAECVDRLLAASPRDRGLLSRFVIARNTVMAQRNRGSVLLWVNSTAEDETIRLDLTFHETGAGTVLQGRPVLPLLGRGVYVLIFSVWAVLCTFALGVTVWEAVLGQPGAVANLLRVLVFAGAVAAAFVAVSLRHRWWDRADLGLLTRHVEAVLEARPLEEAQPPPDSIEVIELGDAATGPPP